MTTKNNINEYSLSISKHREVSKREALNILHLLKRKTISECPVFCGISVFLKGNCI